MNCEECNFKVDCIPNNPCSLCRYSQVNSKCKPCSECIPETEQCKFESAPIYFGVNPESKFMKRLKKLICDWDFGLNNHRYELNKHYYDMWELAEAALFEITSQKFNFTRTDDYYGICNNDEEFLIKVERKIE